MSQETRPAYMPRLSISYIGFHCPTQREIIMAMRQIDSSVSGSLLGELVTELLLPGHFFEEDARKFSAIYQEVRDYLNCKRENLRTHSSHRIF